MKAVVLARRDFREHDQVISLFTKEKGKQEVLARGVKKIKSKNAAHLEPCSVVDVEIVPGKRIDHLTKVIPLDAVIGIRTNLRKNVIAQYLCSFVHRMTEVDEPDKYIFYSLTNAVQFLSNAEDIQLLFLDGFMLNFFSHLGYQPELEQCVVTGKKTEDKYFYTLGGGVVTFDVAEEKKRHGEVVLKFSPGLKKLLKLLLEGDFEKIQNISLSKKQYTIAHRLIIQFLQCRTDKKIVDWHK
jgi:DNA repair protein RecO (recombination protein O)